MIDWVDLTSDKRCASCRWFRKGRHCWLYVQEMRTRGAKENFWGPNLPVGQHACRKWEKAPHGGSGEFKYSPSSGDDSMTSFADRYPRQGGTFLNADHLRGKPDLVVWIDRVDLNFKVGSKVRDIIRFKGSEFSLILNQTTGTTIASLYGDDIDGWADNPIALFCDETVEFDDDSGVHHVGGVRVRPFKPDGAPPVTVSSSAKKPDFDDQIPF
jgi:hypothetical protein